MVLPVIKNNNSISLDQLKKTVNDIKAKADKSKVQEEYLLKQLKEHFEVENLEEAKELLEAYINEKNKYESENRSDINDLIQKMQEENLI